MNVKSVSLYFPMSEQGDNVHYAVGVRDVTVIIPTQNQAGVFCYRIYKKDKDGKSYLDSELYHYSHVIYEIE